MLKWTMRVAVVLGLVPFTNACAQNTAREEVESGPANRLVDETSPALRAHAGDPVEWYPWGAEAFAAARRDDKPVFLAIVHATNHWSHVMHRESFKDEEIALQLNRNFVPILVDGAEHPELEAIYSAGVETLARRGGFPLAAFLEPERLRPFEGGTYYRPTTFLRLLRQTDDRWRTDRTELLKAAGRAEAGIVSRLANLSEPQSLGQVDIDRALTLLLATHDLTNGGFQRGRVKLAHPARLELVAALGWNDSAGRVSLLYTLDRMATGGFFDQLGGGFHHLSTDAFWGVPDFEKRLADNAQLASIYARAHELTNDVFYAQITRLTLDYVLRELAAPEGGFFRAQDTETETHLGAFYVWTSKDFTEALTNMRMESDIDFAKRVFGVTGPPNFTQERFPGPAYVLQLGARPDTASQRIGLEQPVFDMRYVRVRTTLFNLRNNRPHPAIDRTVIASDCGLMIRALVDGARALEAPRYLDIARETAGFVLGVLRDEQGRLTRAWCDGVTQVEGLAVDYALVIQGLLALNDATAEPEWLLAATDLAGLARKRFWDDSMGGYFETPADRTDLIVRQKTVDDQIVPSANSVMLLNLLDLYERHGDERYLEDARATLGVLSRPIARSANRCSIGAVALQRVLSRYPRIAEVRDPQE